MANTTQNSLKGFTGLSKFLYKLFVGILIVGVIAFLMSLLSSVAYTKLPQKWLDVLASPFTWITQNPLLALAIFIIFLLLIAIFYLMSRSSGNIAEASQTVRVEVVPVPPVPVPSPAPVSMSPSEQELLNTYCSRLEEDNRRLKFEGIPTTVIKARGVQLNKVFIPLRLIPQPMPVDTFSYGKSDITRFEQFRRQAEQASENLPLFLLEFAHGKDNFDDEKSIDIASLWQRLTPDEPVAFIEGIPGMGKSTLLTRLMLYMARTLQTGKDDKDMPPLTPLLFPIFVSLKEYAAKRDIPSNQLSLLDFIKHDVQEQFGTHEHVSALIPFIEQWLRDCACLVMFDGLDEVSDPKMQQTVCDAINEFIEQQRYPDKHLLTFNRFLVTSRVAGYPVEEFKTYRHYKIAPLTLEQIQTFLPQWCYASIDRELREDAENSDEVIAREAREKAQELLSVIKSNQAARELAEIPLLLTMLAAMHRKDAPLPDRRAKLYKVVIETLLMERNKAKRIDTLSVADALQRLGPLAYEMHKHNSLALDEDYVRQKLAEAIHAQQQTSSTSQQTVHIDDSEYAEAVSYLKRLSVRGGLFVKRVGNYYDFTHRSFEEYFAAQYLLTFVEKDRPTGIEKFIEHVTANRELWREPYLLAVSSKSESDRTTASSLVYALFRSSQATQNLDLLLLTAVAIIEAEPDTIIKIRFDNLDVDPQRQISDALIQCYTTALRTKKFEDCQRIEQTMTRWLLTLPKDAFRPPVLLSLLEHILNSPQAEQRSTLKLLTLIMQDILTGSQQIFNTLMPVLLAIAGLPAIVGNERTVEPADAKEVPMSSDPMVRDYAFTILSTMRQRGPGGILLSKTREKVEPHLEQLAHYSLECGTLITPTNIPLTEEHYKPYEKTIAEWIKLRDELEQRTYTAADVTQCIAIHQELLLYAEDINYGVASPLEAMLKISASSPDSWKNIWQRLLLKRLIDEQDIVYFNIALFWSSLFIERDEQELLARQLKQDFQSESKHLSSTRFISYIAENLQKLRYLHNLRYTRDSQNLRQVKNLLYLQYLRDLRYFREPQELRNFRRLWEQDLRHFRNSQYFRSFQYFQDFFFINEVTQICLNRIDIEFSDSQVDLLLILLGRILQIGEDSPNTSPEQEIQHIVQKITPFCTSTIDDVRDAALDILRYLPVRTENEIRFVIEGAEQAKDERVREAYCYALQYARLEGKSKQDVLKQLGMKSQVKEVRAAVEEALRRAW